MAEDDRTRIIARRTSESAAMVADLKPPNTLVGGNPARVIRSIAA